MRTTFTAPLVIAAIGAAILAPRLLADRLTPPATLAPPLSALPAVPLLGPAVAGGPALTVTLDRDTVAAGGQVRALVEIQAPVGGTSVPTDLTLVIDRSGSMSGAKLAQAQRAAEELIGQLGGQDRVSLVSFGSDATTDLALSPVSGATWSAVASLRTGGGTNLNGGLQQALRGMPMSTSGRAQRVIVLSDGHPDDRNGWQPLVAQMVERAAVTTVGIGEGYDPVYLQQIADAGTGNAYWANPQTPLAGVFAAELDGARSQVASSTSLTWSGPAGVRVVDWGGLQSKDGQQVALGSLFSGQRRQIWVTFEVPDTVGPLELGRLELAWNGASLNTDREVVSHAASLGQVALTRDLNEVYTHVDEATWAKAVVEDGYNAMLAQVSQAVASGDTSTALQALDTYQLQNQQMNAVVKSAKVHSKLQEVEQLRKEVERPMSRRRVVEMQTNSYQGRRSGNSKLY